MADILLPPWLTIASAKFRYIDSTGLTRNPYTGKALTASLGGDRIGATVDLTKQGGASTRTERAALTAFTFGMRGKQNRVWLMDPSYTPRGSFQAGELLSNNTFDNTTTGWSHSNAEATLSVADRRIMAKLVKGGGGGFIGRSSSVTVTQYAPYVARAFVRPIRGNWSLQALVGSTNGAFDYGISTATTDFGLVTASAIPSATTVFPSFGATGASGRLAGDAFGLEYASLTRCMLVDNTPNGLLRSDEINDAAWTKTNCTAFTNTGTAPDGAATAESLAESNDGAPTTHFISQTFAVSSAAQDMCIYGYFKGNARTACWISLVGSSSTSDAHFNLATGAITSSSAGAGWSNQRAFITDMGNSWYLCQLVARKTNSDTSITCRFGIGNPAGVSTYTGNGAGDIFLWRLGAAVTSVPVTPGQTTSAALASGTSQTGSVIYVKGLPASTSGLLLYGDWVQLNNQLNMVVDPLDSNSAGLGVLRCALPWRYSPTNQDPVIVTNPMGRFLYAGNQPEYSLEPGLFSAASFDFEEAAA